MRGRAGWGRADTLCLLLLAGLVGLFSWRLLAPNPADRAVFPAGDFSDQFYAFRLYEARELAQGRLPLWSENFNAGHPFLADIQAAVFYPPALVNTVLNAALTGGGFAFFALEGEALVHLWLAGAFTYLLARRLALGRVAALASAIVFTFGGYLTSFPPLQLAILETAAWLPLFLYFLHRGATGGFNRDLAWAGITLGIAALAGHPQTLLFLVYAGAAFYLLLIAPRQRREAGEETRTWVGRLAPLALTLAIAFGIAAVQLVPSLEYQRLSTRETISFAEAGRGLSTLDLLQFILPGYTSAFASPLYVGVLPLWLALAALVGRGTRGSARAIFGWLGVGALLVAFGFYVFAYAPLYLFAPGFGIFRQQERLALVVSLALAILAGYGLEALLAPERGGGLRRLWGLLPAGATLAGLMLAVFFLGGVERASGRLAFLGDRAGLMLLLFLLASGLVGASLARRIGPRLLGVLAVALVVFDLFSVDEPANRAAPYERYPATALMAQARVGSGFARAASTTNKLPGHFGIAYGLEEIGGISPLRLQTYSRLLQLAPERLWPLLNVKYIFAEENNYPATIVVGEGEAYKLLDLKRSLPRAWLVGAAEIEPEEGRALARLADVNFDPARTVLLAAAPPFPPAAGASEGSVRIFRTDPEHWRFEVNSPSAGLLVVSENDYPGWQAWVDGEAAPILRADVALRAVPLRAGTHRVELVFDPLSLKLGAVVTAATLILLAGGALRPGTERRAKREAWSDGNV